MEGGLINPLALTRTGAAKGVTSPASKAALTSVHRSGASGLKMPAAETNRPVLTRTGAIPAGSPCA